MRKTLVFGTTLLLLAASLAMAMPQAQGQKASTHQAVGTVKSVEGDTLVVSHKVGGKEQETTFVLNAQTKREGTMKTGAKVTVHYKVEGGQNIATVVQAPKK
jgi:hypothetical protein